MLFLDDLRKMEAKGKKIHIRLEFFNVVDTKVFDGYCMTTVYTREPLFSFLPDDITPFYVRLLEFGVNTSSKEIIQFVEDYNAKYYIGKNLDAELKIGYSLEKEYNFYEARYNILRNATNISYGKKGTRVVTLNNFKDKLIQHLEIIRLADIVTLTRDHYIHTDTGVCIEYTHHNLLDNGKYNTVSDIKSIDFGLENTVITYKDGGITTVSTDQYFTLLCKIYLAKYKEIEYSGVVEIIMHNMMGYYSTPKTDIVLNNCDHYIYHIEDADGNTYINTSVGVVTVSCNKQTYMASRFHVDKPIADYCFEPKVAGLVLHDNRSPLGNSEFFTTRLDNVLSIHPKYVYYINVYNGLLEIDVLCIVCINTGKPAYALIPLSLLRNYINIVRNDFGITFTTGYTKVTLEHDTVKKLTHSEDITKCFSKISQGQLKNAEAVLNNVIGSTMVRDKHSVEHKY